MRIALVHEWLITRGGAERCLEAFCDMWPKAPIYTLFYDPVAFQESPISQHRIITTPLDRSFFRKHYQKCLPLLPYFVEQWDFRNYDVVLSANHAVAKGIVTPPETCHISWIHSPMRYAWHLKDEYLERADLTRGPSSWTARWILHRLRQWDYAAAARVDHFAANSHAVAKRVEKYYRRSAQVLHPLVDLDRFHPTSPKEDFFLFLSRLVPYKRVDLAIAAANELQVPLVIAGDGPHRKRAEALAGPTIRFVGAVSDQEASDLLARARALLFPPEEDFGIVPVEAMASGTPVIALARGGALDTVVDIEVEGPEKGTGLFFQHDDPKDLVEAMKRFMALEGAFQTLTLQKRARTFCKEAFVAHWHEFFHDLGL